MKKTILILMGVLAAAAFADRTANREWVGRNFAPSNLVPRVEALENKTDSETLALGEDSFAECTDAVAIGAGASASGLGTVQLGRGENTNPETLRFHGWTVIDSDGKVPQERLPEVPPETDPKFNEWRYTATGVSIGGTAVIENTGVAIGGSTYAKDDGVAIGYCAIASGAGSSQIGPGINEAAGTLQYKGWRLVESDGTIPAARLPSKWATGNLTNANGVGLVELKDKTTTIEAGERWTPSAKRDDSWYTVAYGNGVFVAGNYSGRGLWYSSDGINWTQSTQWSDNWYALAYGNGRFIANGGAGGRIGIWYSDDGKNWSQSSLTSGHWQGLAFGNGRFIAVRRSAGDTSSIHYSDDGINWTPSALSSGYELVGVAYGNGRFIAGGFIMSSSYTGHGMLYSDDGINWTRSNITSGGWGVLAYGNGVFVAGSSNGTGLWYSTDGATWTQSTMTSGILCGLAYVNGRFLAGKDDNTGILCSFDGINWMQGEKTSGHWRGFACGNGRIVGLGVFTDGIWYSDPFEVKSVPLVQRIRVNGIELTADEDNVVDIPIATLKSALGIE